MGKFKEYFLKEDLDETYLYHATYKQRLKSIKLKGLIVDSKRKNWEDSKNVIYLANDYDVAYSYAETSDMVPEDYLDNIIVFKINIKHLDMSCLFRDENVMDDESTFQYTKNIPFNWLEIVNE